MKKTSEIFVINNLYRDEISNPNNPTQLEVDLAKYTQESTESIVGYGFAAIKLS